MVDALDLCMVLRWVRMYACDLGIVSLFVELFSAYLQSCECSDAISPPAYYHVTSEEELAVVALLLDLFCVYADNTLPTVALQASILSTLMNLFSGYHSTLARSHSRLAVICQAFLQPSFRATLAALLSHIFRLSCCLHNLDATATPAAPARDTKTLTLACHASPSTLGGVGIAGATGAGGTAAARASVSQSSVFCINLTPKRDASCFRRRHCLSKSARSLSPFASQTTQTGQTGQTGQTAVSLLEGAPVRLTAEEMAFNWTSLVSHLLQFIQGVVEYDEGISGTAGMG